jgi:hypothetical protein
MPRQFKIALFAAGLLAAGQCAARPAVCVARGELRWQLVYWSAAAGVQILYDWNEMGAVRTRGGCWFDAASAFTGLLAGTPFTWAWINDRTIGLEPIGECRPDLGAAAPLPPCSPPALQVHR